MCLKNVRILLIIIFSSLTLSTNIFASPVDTEVVINGQTVTVPSTGVENGNIYVALLMMRTK